MLRVLLPVIFVVVAGNQQNDPAAVQLATFRDNTKCPIGTLTTNTGAPVEYKEATNTINSPFLHNEHLFDSLVGSVTENIPDRPVHGSGTGAFGYFKATHDMSHITMASLFGKVGKKTPVACRFSQFSAKGSVDTIRESRGHACKFQTDQGTLDITFLDLEILGFKDPLLFPPVVHAFKRNPVTNLPDSNMIWDFVTQNPVSLNQVVRIFSKRGMPRSYRDMPGFGIHTNQFYNKTGHSHFAKFFMIPTAGAKYFNLTESIQLQSGDPNHYTRDLYNAIAKQDYPRWYLKLQIIPECDVFNPDLGIFDVTRLQSTEEYPLQELGEICLNKNPLNHFADIEQLAFSPGNLVPGMLGSPDDIFSIRRFLYRASGNYRLGSNFKNIEVNRPMFARTLTYNRDGVPPVYDNGKSGPNYYPNSYNGPEPYVDKNRPSLIKVYIRPETNNFDQVANFISNTLNSQERSELLQVVVENLCTCEERIKNQAMKVLKNIHFEFGMSVAKGVAANCKN